MLRWRSVSACMCRRFWLKQYDTADRKQRWSTAAQKCWLTWLVNWNNLIVTTPPAVLHTHISCWNETNCVKYSTRAVGHFSAVDYYMYCMCWMSAASDTGLCSVCHFTCEISQANVIRHLLSYLSGTLEGSLMAIFCYGSQIFIHDRLPRKKTAVSNLLEASRMVHL